MIAGLKFRPTAQLQKMREESFQIGLNGVKFGKTHVLDLLDNMVPIDVIHTLPARDAAQQGGLAFRPGEGVTVVKIVGHGETVIPRRGGFQR